MNVLQESAKEDLVKKLVGLINETETIYTRIASEYPKMLGEFESGFSNSNQQINLIGTEGGTGLDALHMIMDRTRGCIQNAHESFTSLSRADTELLDMLKESIRSLDTLDELIGSITFNTEEMELISLNAMVVALKAGHEGGGFSHVTDELRRVSAKTISQAQSLTGEGNQIQLYFNEVQKTADKIAHEQETLFSQFGASLFENFSTIENRLLSVVDFFKSLQSRAGDLRDPLTTMMEAVQTQDLIRQTIEQIIVTLDEIKEVDLSQSAENRDDLLLDELTFLEQVSHLGANLLNDIGNTITENSEIFRSNIDQIQVTVERIENERNQFISDQIEGGGSGDDAINELFHHSEQALSIMLKNARRVPKLKQSMRTTNSSFIERIQGLEEGFQQFSILVGRFRNINVAARIEVAKRQILQGMNTTVNEMRTLTETIYADVEKAIETTRIFIETTQTAVTGFKDSNSRENEFVASFSSEIQQLYTRLKNTNDEIVRTMKGFNLFTHQFRNLVESSQEDASELAGLARRARYIEEIFERTAKSAASRREHLLNEQGLETWTIREQRLQDIVERFTIYAHKAKAGEIGGFLVEEGTTEGEVTFF